MELVMKDLESALLSEWVYHIYDCQQTQKNTNKKTCKTCNTIYCFYHVNNTFLKQQKNKSIQLFLVHVRTWTQKLFFSLLYLATYSPTHSLKQMSEPFTTQWTQYGTSQFDRSNVCKTVRAGEGEATASPSESARSSSDNVSVVPSPSTQSPENQIDPRYYLCYGMSLTIGVGIAAGMLMK
jgi:hypothetical protein